MSVDPGGPLSTTFQNLVESGRFEEAYKHCLPLAEAGNAEAQMHVGWLHHVGQGVERNLEEAERWYRRALAVESPRVEFYLASICWARDQREKKNEWLERAA